jgi:hypothetical protein
MASFFGSVATEVGETVKDLGQQKREERLANEEAQREMMLQKMRMQFESSELDRRISADDRRQQRRLDYESAQAEADAKREREEAEATREHQMGVEELRAETDLLQEAMRQYFSKSRTRSMSGNGYTMKNEPQQTIDPLSGQIVYQDSWSGTAPGGQPLSVVGDKVFRGGGAQEVYPFQSIEQQRQAEQALLEGKVDADRFYDDFGYYPSSFIFGQVSKDDANFQQWAERNNIRIPNLFSPDDRRGGGSKGGKGGKGSPESRLLPPKMEDDYEYPPAAPMQPSIEELSEGPERDAHIAAQGGRTNEEIAAEMRAEAQGGGRLSQAEMLTQGGQLEQPAAAATGGGESPYGFEMDDQTATGIASAVSGAMSPEATAIQQTGEKYGYGGTL